MVIQAGSVRVWKAKQCIAKTDRQGIITRDKNHHMAKPGLKVFAPATISNVAVGFDILGFALQHPGDEIIVREGNTPGLTIGEIQGAGGRIPTDVLRNTATVAAQALLDHLGEGNRPLQMDIHKKMPIGSGLGSSAASAVAGVFAVSEYFRTGMSKSELLPFAMQGERVNGAGLPADNVAACLLGGMVLLRDNVSFDYKKLPVPAGLYAAVVHPHIEIITSASRQSLSSVVPLHDVILQTGNLACFVAGMYTSDFELIGRSLRDVLIEPQRAAGIPYFTEMQEQAMDAGALGFSISGAGPTMFALCDSSIKAERVLEAAQTLYASKKLEITTYLSKINHEGVVRF